MRLGILCLLTVVLGASAAQAQVNGYVVVNGSLLVVDASTQVVVATVPGLALPRAVDVSPVGSRIYVTIFNGVAVIDAATNTLLTTVATGNIPIGTVFTPDGSTAYVGNNASGTVSVIDTATQTVVSTFPASPQPWGIDFMPDRDVDGIGEIYDNCSVDANPGQADAVGPPSSAMHPRRPVSF
ncbi:MAG: YncE family protein [Thermoanaerobaculia bacterium]|nr:YncE family protein [Thermoanaerobaculia bacterium]